MPRLDCLTNSHLNEQVIWEILMNPTLFKADSQWLSENTQIAQTAPTSTNYYYNYNSKHQLPPVLVQVQVQEQGKQLQQPPLPLPLPVPPPTAATNTTTARQRRLLLLLLLLYYWYYSYQEYLSKCTLLPFPIPQLPPLLLVYCCYYCCQCYCYSCSSETTNNPKHTELNNPPKKIFTSSKQITIYNNKPCQFSGHASLNNLQNHP